MPLLEIAQIAEINVSPLHSKRAERITELKKQNPAVPLSVSCPEIKHYLAKKAPEAYLWPHKNPPKLAENDGLQGTEKHILAIRNEIKQFLAKNFPLKFNEFSSTKHSDSAICYLKYNKTSPTTTIDSIFSNH